LTILIILKDSGFWLVL